MFKGFSKSAAYLRRYPGVGFALSLITGCRNNDTSPGLDQYKRKLLRQMRKREILTQITERIQCYDLFFKQFGHVCPLPKHLDRAVHSGFPRYSLMIDSHFIAELCAGILVAVADYDRVAGALTLDVASEGEECLGLGERGFTTREDEIVLRDEKEIICVLCQGADEKTRVQPDTQNVLFYAYAVPGIDPQHLRQGIGLAADTMVRFGDGKIDIIEVY
jgi:DNA/RNA-binding domain of Phe-tRNA-synthetase-like protein